MGLLLTLAPALAAVLLVTDSFKVLIFSQGLLSIQLPITILLHLSLTSSRKVMGSYTNAGIEKFLLWTTGAVVILLNLLLLKSVLIGSLTGSCGLPIH